MKEGLDFLNSIKDRCKGSLCQGCNQDCGGTALVDLVYTFEICRCEKADYSHLTETLWHKTCFYADYLSKLKKDNK